MARVLLIALPLMVLLAGCFGTPNQGRPSMAEAQLPVEETEPGMNGTASEAMQPIPPAQPIVRHCTITLNGSKAAHGISGGLVLGDQCPWPESTQRVREQIHSAVVEVSWVNLQPTILDVNLTVNLPDCSSVSLPLPGFEGRCGVAFVVGATSPLRLELVEEHLARERSRTFAVAVSPRGVFVQQDFTVAITLFPDSAPPVGYTALS
jgi:hypothetical protein